MKEIAGSRASRDPFYRLFCLLVFIFFVFLKIFVQKNVSGEQIQCGWGFALLKRFFI